MIVNKDFERFDERIWVHEACVWGGKPKDDEELETVEYIRVDLYNKLKEEISMLKEENKNLNRLLMEDDDKLEMMENKL